MRTQLSPNTPYTVLSLFGLEGYIAMDDSMGSMLRSLTSASITTFGVWNLCARISLMARCQSERVVQQIPKDMRRNQRIFATTKLPEDLFGSNSFDDYKNCPPNST